MRVPKNFRPTNWTGMNRDNIVQCYLFQLDRSADQRRVTHLDEDIFYIIQIPRYLNWTNYSERVVTETETETKSTNMDHVDSGVINYIVSDVGPK